VIWLGDEAMTRTDIDDLCRFIKDTIVTIIETNTEDNNYLPLGQPKAFTRNWKTGVSIIVALPMQNVYFEDLRLPASYANFLILNKCVLVPTFNDPTIEKP
jgi:agmatine deiminase